jgi:hypothetical protein
MLRGILGHLPLRFNCEKFNQELDTIVMFRQCGQVHAKLLAEHAFVRPRPYFEEPEPDFHFFQKQKWMDRAVGRVGNN